MRAFFPDVLHIQPRAPADVLLIPHTCGTRELSDLIEDGACLREGGTLIVQSTSERFVQDYGGLPALFQTLGYQVEQHLCDRGREIYIARRCGSGGFRKAA